MSGGQTSRGQMAAVKCRAPTSRDPHYITPAIKAKLRRKNRLQRAGRVEEADALAKQIGQDIANRNKTRLIHTNHKTSSKDMWAAVRQLTGRSQTIDVVDGITAESLNQHYACISTDVEYRPPQRKQTGACHCLDVVSEFEVFRILDNLPDTATGLDKLPAWFLRIGAAAFCKPITRLFNRSIATSVIPQQWKSASIRTIECIVVRRFLCPAIHTPPAALL